jgi:hypothetical protein
MVADGLVKATKEPKKPTTYSATQEGIRWLRDYKSLRDRGGLGKHDKKPDNPDF